MKRSDIILDIASTLVHTYTDFMSFDKTQELAELVLDRIEKEGMLPPCSYENIKDHPNMKQIWKWDKE